MPEIAFTPILIGLRYVPEPSQRVGEKKGRKKGLVMSVEKKCFRGEAGYYIQIKK